MAQRVRQTRDQLLPGLCLTPGPSGLFPTSACPTQPSPLGGWVMKPMQAEREGPGTLGEALGRTWGLVPALL